jgi:hypothetical protein
MVGIIVCCVPAINRLAINWKRKRFPRSASLIIQYLERFTSQIREHTGLGQTTVAVKTEVGMDADLEAGQIIPRPEAPAQEYSSNPNSNRPEDASVSEADIVAAVDLMTTGHCSDKGDAVEAEVSYPVHGPGASLNQLDAIDAGRVYQRIRKQVPKRP